MTEVNQEYSQEENEQIKKGTWLDLAYYLFGGFGLFILASIYLGSFFSEITLSLTVLTIVLNLIFVGGSAYVLGILREKISWKQLGINPAIWKWEYLFLAAILAIGLMPVRSVIGILAQYLFEGGLDSLMVRESLFSAGGVTWSGFFITFFGVGILAPVSEELYFRGLLHTWFRQRWGMWASIFASSFLFGLAHFDSIGVLVSSFIMGLVMAYVYEKTKTLWITIAIHVITNSIAVLLMYIIMLAASYFDLPTL